MNDPSIFKNTIKTLLKDQFLQHWNSPVNNSPKCLNYKLYKLTSLGDPGRGRNPPPPLKVVEHRSQKASECTI